MARWRWLLPLALLAACAEPPPGPEAEPPAVVRAATEARMARTLDRSLVVAPRPAAAPLAEPAPLPNRAIEAPRDRRGDSLNPSFEPLTLPSDRAQGFTFGNELPRDTGRDRPLEGVVQGARVRIPFE